MELYLDLYGNALVRDKTQSYLEEVTKELIQLVTEDSKCTSPIQELINFETLKFKERDEVEDIFSSYLSKHKFDIEQLRDQRVRALLKERYDVKQNMTDWDYNFGIKDYSKTVNQREYK
jgi:dynein assembly factor 3